MAERLRRRRGQIVVPFLLILPSMFLFVLLIYETAKLSREKIRHQFALDSAAFIEMSHYSDFLNRSAHVNGAFPQMLFREAFEDVKIDHKRDSSSASLYDIIWKNGAFPRWPAAEAYDPGDPAEVNEELIAKTPLWPIRFEGCGEWKNDAVPNLNYCSDKPDTLDLITLDNANDYWLTWDDAQDVYRLFVEVYQLLGSVADSQVRILKNLTGERKSFRKSYWLNSGTSLEEAGEGADWFNKNGGRVGSQFTPAPYCLKEVMIHGTKPTKNPYQPYQLFKPNQALEMMETISDCKPGKGLFQVMTVDPDQLKNLKTLHPGSPWPGFPVVQHWDTGLSDNFFKVDFRGRAPCPEGGGGPCVHATAAVTHPAADNKGLWPDPTPRFQVKLYP